MMLVEWGWPPAVALAAVMALGGCLGAAHGLLVTRLRLQPFIVTLCGLLLYRGAARYIADDSTKGFGTGAGLRVGAGAGVGQRRRRADAVRADVRGGRRWPGCCCIARCTGGTCSPSATTRRRRATRASARGRSIAWAYVLSGVLAAVSAILIAFYTNSISPASHGNFYELYAIAAAVVGGCSLRGGEGSVLGIVMGAALLQVLRNLVNLLDIPGSLDFAVMGAVILIGAIADQLFGRRMRRGVG